MKKLFIYGLFAVLTVCACFSNCFAANVTLAWDANTDAVAGYKLYFGLSSGSYTTTVDAGNVTSFTLTGLQDGQTYFFAATAYDSSGNESDYSEELVCHTVTPNAGTGGAISPGSTMFVTNGMSQSFAITPNAGYAIADVLVDGVSVGAVASYTFANISSQHFISATFSLIPVNYTITASVSGAGGMISPSGTATVASGANKTYSITPNAGYKVSNVLVNGTSVGTVTTYTFTNVTSNKTIVASFTPATYTISASAGTGGTISPSGAVTVTGLTNRTFAITPNAGYKVANVLVDGASVGAVTSYTFNSITTNHAITASFAPNSFTITASAGPNGTISPSGTVNVASGGSQTFTITPNTGYRVENVLVDGVSKGAITSFTFLNVIAAHAISASFTSLPPAAPVIKIESIGGLDSEFDHTVIADFTSPDSRAIEFNVCLSSTSEDAYSAMPECDLGVYSTIPGNRFASNTINIIAYEMVFAGVKAVDSSGQESPATVAYVLFGDIIGTYVDGVRWDEAKIDEYDWNEMLWWSELFVGDRLTREEYINGQGDLPLPSEFRMDYNMDSMINYVDYNVMYAIWGREGRLH